MSLAADTSTWLWYVTQEPSDNVLTCRPLRPRRRYCIHAPLLIDGKHSGPILPATASLRFLYTRHANLNCVFMRPNPYSSPYFIERSIMDVVFIGGAIALWFAMVLMVWGLKKLEKPEATRP